MPAWELYDLLLDYAGAPDPVDEVIIGPIWTLCRSGNRAGLAMSPQVPTRTLPWPGSLTGRSLGELAAWVKDWEPYAATVGMAALNAAFADLTPPPSAAMAEPGAVLPANLSVFEHFLPRLADRRVVVIGRYPGLDALAAHCHLTVLERTPGPGDLPDAACEYVLPDADWVFITASSLTNKTFPRLAELCRHAETVLMGPTLPWLPEFADFGIGHLAGVEVVDLDVLRRALAEGGGVRIFDTAVRYRIVELSAPLRLDWIKARIAQVFAEKQRLDQTMEAWHATRRGRFPDLARLEHVRARLSRLDTAYKRLWDQQK